MYINKPHDRRRRRAAAESSYEIGRFETQRLPLSYRHYAESIQAAILRLDEEADVGRITRMLAQARLTA